MSTHMAKGMRSKGLKTACGREAWFRIGSTVLALPTTREAAKVDCPDCLRAMQEAA